MTRYSIGNGKHTIHTLYHWLNYMKYTFKTSIFDDRHIFHSSCPVCLQICIILDFLSFYQDLIRKSDKTRKLQFPLIFSYIISKQNFVNLVHLRRVNVNDIGIVFLWSNSFFANSFAPVIFYSWGMFCIFDCTLIQLLSGSTKSSKTEGQANPF